MAFAFQILVCLTLFVLLVQGSTPLKRDDPLSESKIQSVSDNAVETAKASRKKRDLFLTLSMISAASSFLTRGNSFAQGEGSLLNTGVSINIAIELENYSNWILGSPLIYTKSGHVRIPPRIVHPGEREVMVAHKTSWSFKGTWGSVSWRVGNNTEKRVIVMWSIPYSYWWFSNWLAVGIIDDEDVGSQWTSHMYYGQMGETFSRGQYYYHSKKIEFCDATMCVAGSMGTVYSTHAHISFYPKDANYLAPNIHNRMIGLRRTPTTTHNAHVTQNVTMVPTM